MVFDTPPIAVAVETEQRPIAKDKYERHPVASDAHQTLHKFAVLSVFTKSR